jgi:enamine deaminase RidA (YjgF/YER057c/UK114 family)
MSAFQARINTGESLERGRIGSASYSLFRTASGFDELHLVVHPGIADLSRCLTAIAADRKACLERIGNPDAFPFMTRMHAGPGVFRSEAFLASGFPLPASVSLVDQAPLDGSAVVLYAWYLIPHSGVPVAEGPGTMIRTANYDFHYSGGLTALGPDISVQTAGVFSAYREMLRVHGIPFPGGFIRSWIYVRDIDHCYTGMVEARKAFFFANGLSAQGPFPASTGIGSANDGADLIHVDFLSIGRLAAGQVRPMECLDVMPAARSYGVTFERGLCLEFGDRNQIQISGTASIDCNGRVVHEGDPAEQTRRTIRNLDGLLATRNATRDDLTHLNVYLRSAEVAETVRRILDVEFGPAVPYLILHGPVCRPGWLVEIDGTALKSAQNDWPDLI